MTSRLKKVLYDTLVETEDEALPDRVVAGSLMVLIIANVFAVMLETVQEVETGYARYFRVFEVFSVVVFSLEYLIRLWISELDSRYHGGLRGKVRYILSPMALIDLAAILPFYLPMAFAVDLRMLRILRLFRVFRLFKMTRYVESLNTLRNVFKAKRSELVITLLMITMLLIFASSAMYSVENSAQPDKFPNIPATLWWGVITLTTIGYGDIYPITPVGKIIGGVIAFLGIGLFALPAGILASGFSEEVHRSQEEKKKRTNKKDNH